MKNREIKFGAILSYVLIFINTVYGLILTPFMLAQVGNSEYGVYKAIGSITATMMILDFGIGSTIQRYTAKFKVDGDHSNVNNFYAMGLYQGVFISLFIVLIGTGVFFSLDSLYGTSFTDLELIRSKQIFILLILSMVIHVFDRIFQGVISGHNKFVFTNVTKIISIGLRTILLFSLLPKFNNSITIVVITILIDIIVTIASIVYIRKNLGVKSKLVHWDKKLFNESLKYSIAIFVQSIIGQIVSNSDNVIIGAMKGTELVTIYSFGLLIFGMFQNLSSSISQLLLPTIMQLLKDESNKQGLIDFIKKVGKIQYVLIGGAFFGFIVLGQEFINLWLGSTFKDVWIITIILMVPAIWELTTNSFLAVLRAKNKLVFRTIILAFTALINVLLTIIGVYYFGYISAAWGTAISMFFNLIMINIYYFKKLKINSFKIFFDIIFKITLCLPIPIAVTLLLNFFMSNLWLFFVIKVAVFCLIYATLLGFIVYRIELRAFFNKLRNRNQTSATN